MASGGVFDYKFVHAIAKCNVSFNSSQFKGVIFFKWGGTACVGARSKPNHSEFRIIVSWRIASGCRSWRGSQFAIGALEGGLSCSEPDSIIN